MINMLKKEWTDGESRVEKVYNILIENQDKLSELTILKHGKRKLNSEAIEFTDWEKSEIRELEKKLINFRPTDNVNREDEIDERA